MDTKHPKKIIAFSTEFTTENGQAVVTRRVVKHVIPDVGGGVLCVYPSGGGVGSLVGWITVCCKLLWTICTSRVGVVYVVCSRTTVGFIRDLPGLLTVYLGKRVIVHCHGSDFESFLLTGPLSGLARRVYCHCEVVFPSRHLSERMKDKVKIAHVCENFFVALEDCSTEADYDPSCLRVVWNSNIMASKGFFDVAAAVEMLVKKGLSIELLCFGNMLGDHEMRKDDVRKKVRNFEGCDWFSYLGMLHHSSAVGVLQNGDVVALPSRYKSEMQPLAILEAMGAGKQIIISDHPSLHETVGDYPADIVRDKYIPETAGYLEELYVDKMSNPDQFKVKNMEAAAYSANRFSTKCFDMAMKTILSHDKVGAIKRDAGC